MTKKDIQKTILVIDDDPILVKALTKKLPESGYAVLAATKAADGLQIVMDQYPDLVVLDVMMPIINGYNLCQLLKKDPKHKRIPVVLLTCRHSEKDKLIGQEMGADAYLIKPLDISLLLKTIEELLKA